MCDGGGAGGGGDSGDTRSRSFGQDFNADGRVGFGETLRDMFDGGGRGRNAAGNTFSATVSDRSTLSSLAPVSTARPMSRPANLMDAVAARNERNDFVEAELARQGLTTSSPNASRAIAQAQNAFAATPAGANLARQEAMLDFHRQTSRMGTVDQGLIDMAQGRVAGATPQQIEAAQRELGSALVGSKAPGATFDDPFGGLLEPSVQRTGSLLGSNVDAKGYVANVSRGYNSESGIIGGIGGRDLAVDAAGNIGFSTFGQRALNTAGRFATGALLGSVSPNLGLAAGGLNFTSMTPYDNMYGRSTTEVSFSPANALGSLAFGGVSQAAMPALYRATGDVGTAIAGGIGLGSAAGALTANVAERAVPAISIGTFQGGMPSTGGSMIDIDAERGGGFGGRLSDGGSDGGDSGPGPESGVNAPLQVGESDPPRPVPGIAPFKPIRAIDFTNSTTGADVGSGTTSNFNPNAFIEQNVAAMVPPGGRPTDLSGEDASDGEMNPLFFQPPAGINYLRTGRQRDTGNVTYATASASDAFRSNRRSGFGRNVMSMITG